MQGASCSSKVVEGWIGLGCFRNSNETDLSFVERYGNDETYVLRCREFWEEANLVRSINGNKL